MASWFLIKSEHNLCNFLEWGCHGGGKPNLWLRN